MHFIIIDQEHILNNNIKEKNNLKKKCKMFLGRMIINKVKINSHKITIINKKR